MVRKRNTLLVAVILGVVALWGGWSYAYRNTGVAAGIDAAGTVTIVTWNVRGYPETQMPDRQWFTRELDGLNPDVLCVQEIANQAKVSAFQANEQHYASVAFRDSRDGQDNAIFADRRIALEDHARPQRLSASGASRLRRLQRF